MRQLIDKFLFSFRMNRRYDNEKMFRAYNVIKIDFFFIICLVIYFFIYLFIYFINLFENKGLHKMGDLGCFGTPFYNPPKF